MSDASKANIKRMLGKPPSKSNSPKVLTTRGAVEDDDLNVVHLGRNAGQLVAVTPPTTFELLASPTGTNPTYVSSISHDGRYYAAPMGASPWLKIYKRDGEDYNEITSVAGGLPTNLAFGAKFSPSSTYLAVGGFGATNFGIYKRTGDTFTKLSAPVGGAPGVTTWAFSWTDDEQYLGVSTQGGGNFSVYKREDDTFTKLTTPSITATLSQGCAFTQDGSYLSVTYSDSPYISVYSKSADAFTEVWNGSSLSGFIQSFLSSAWSPDGRYLAIVPGVPIANNGDGTYPGLVVMKRTGDSFERLTITDGMFNIAERVVWTSDGNYIILQASAGTNDGLVAVFRRRGDEIERHATFTYTVSTQTNNVDISADGRYMVLSSYFENTKIFKNITDVPQGSVVRLGGI